MRSFTFGCYCSADDLNLWAGSTYYIVLHTIHKTDQHVTTRI